MGICRAPVSSWGGHAHHCLVSTYCMPGNPHTPPSGRGHLHSTHRKQEVGGGQRWPSRVGCTPHQGLPKDQWAWGRGCSRQRLRAEKRRAVPEVCSPARLPVLLPQGRVRPAGPNCPCQRSLKAEDSRQEITAQTPRQKATPLKPVSLTNSTSCWSTEALPPSSITHGSCGKQQPLEPSVPTAEPAPQSLRRTCGRGGMAVIWKCQKEIAGPATFQLEVRHSRAGPLPHSL